MLAGSRTSPVRRRKCYWDSGPKISYVTLPLAYLVCILLRILLCRISNYLSISRSSADWCSTYICSWTSSMWVLFISSWCRFSILSNRFLSQICLAQSKFFPTGLFSIYSGNFCWKQCEEKWLVWFYFIHAKRSCTKYAIIRLWSMLIQVTTLTTVRSVLDMCMDLAKSRNHSWESIYAPWESRWITFCIFCVWIHDHWFRYLLPFRSPG